MNRIVVGFIIALGLTACIISAPKPVHAQSCNTAQGECGFYDPEYGWGQCRSCDCSVYSRTDQYNIVYYKCAAAAPTPTPVECEGQLSQCGIAGVTCCAPYSCVNMPNSSQSWCNVPPTAVPTSACGTPGAKTTLNPPLVVSIDGVDQPTYSIAAGQHTLAWGAQGTPKYIRIDDTTDGKQCSGSGDYCPAVPNTTTANSYVFNFVAGKTYSIWVHGADSCGNWSATTSNRTVTVAGITPTPIAAPGNLTAKCSADNKSVVISWTAIPGYGTNNYGVTVSYDPYGVAQTRITQYVKGTTYTTDTYWNQKAYENVTYNVAVQGLDANNKGIGLFSNVKYSCPYTAPVTPTTTPGPGCYYKQVQCVQAPCNAILVCPETSKTPTSTPPPGCEYEQVACTDSVPPNCMYQLKCTTPKVSPTPDCRLQPKGDANCNGLIDSADYGFWKNKYLGEAIDAIIKPDFSGDGKVNLTDLEIWTRSIVSGQVTLPTATPVPGAKPDLTIEGVIRDSTGYKATYCNRGGAASGAFVILFSTKSGKEFTTNTNAPFTLPAPGQCAQTGHVACSLIGSDCNDATSVTATADSKGAVDESNESNNTKTQTFEISATAAPSCPTAQCAAPPAGCTYQASNGCSCGALVCVSPTVTPVPPTATAGAGTCVIASADTYVDEALPTQNFGSQTSVKYGSVYSSTDAATYGYTRFYLAYFKFDKTKFPASYTKATFRMYNTATGAGGLDHYLRPVAQDWSEGYMTWQNHPPMSANVNYGFVDTVPTGWKEFDVTTALKQNQAPFGFVIHDSRWSDTCTGTNRISCGAGASRNGTVASKEAAANQVQICFQ